MKFRLLSFEIERMKDSDWMDDVLCLSESQWKLSWSYCEIRTHDSDRFLFKRCRWTLGPHSSPFVVIIYNWQLLPRRYDHWLIYWLIYTQWRTFKLSFNGTIWQTVIHTNQKYKQSNLPPLLTPTSLESHPPYQPLVYSSIPQSSWSLSSSPYPH